MAGGLGAAPAVARGLDRGFVVAVEQVGTAGDTTSGRRARRRPPAPASSPRSGCRRRRSARSAGWRRCRRAPSHAAESSPRHRSTAPRSDARPDPARRRARRSDSLARGRVPAGAAGRVRAASSIGDRSRSRPPLTRPITPSRNARRRSGRAAGRRRRSRPSARWRNPFSTRRRRQCRDAPRARR